MIRIAWDLELEQGFTNPQTPDSKLSEERIIQVGWLVFEAKDGQITILKEQCYCVNIEVPLSKFIRTLTGISDDDIANGTTLTDIYDKIAKDREEFKASRVVCEWGFGDQLCLKRELTVEGFDESKWVFGRSGLNVKHLFQVWCEANGKSASGGLSKSLGKIGLSWSGHGKHNAGVDALNTARIYATLLNKMRHS